MNPFKFGTIVEGKFFTDRVAETAQLEQKLDSENHIVLISPRRFGKSSLVQHVLSQTDRPLIQLDLQYVLSVGISNRCKVEVSRQALRTVHSKG